MKTLPPPTVMRWSIMRWHCHIRTCAGGGYQERAVRTQSIAPANVAYTRLCIRCGDAGRFPLPHGSTAALRYGLCPEIGPAVGTDAQRPDTPLCRWDRYLCRPRVIKGMCQTVGPRWSMQRLRGGSADLEQAPPSRYAAKTLCDATRLRDRVLADGAGLCHEPAARIAALSGSTRSTSRPFVSKGDINFWPAGTWTCLLGVGVGKNPLCYRLNARLETGGVFARHDHPLGRAALDGRISYMAQSDLACWPWLSVNDNIMIGDRLRGAPPTGTRRIDMLARVRVGRTRAKRSRLRCRAACDNAQATLRGTLLEEPPPSSSGRTFFGAGTQAPRAAMQELAAELLSGRTCCW